MPIAARRFVTAEPYDASRSRIGWSGASSQGKASVILWAIHSAVAWAVTLRDISCRRSCLRMTKTKSSRKPAVGTTRKSIAPMPAAWLCRKAFHVCDRPRPLLAIVLGNRRLSDLNPEVQQFAMDPWCTPQPVRQAHLPDQLADLPWYPRPTATSARLPAPVQAEARPTPPDDRFWLDNGDSVQHRREQAIEPDEEQSVSHRQFGFEGRR
jgi:hypothetical protein